MHICMHAHPDTEFISATHQVHLQGLDGFPLMHILSIGTEQTKNTKKISIFVSVKHIQISLQEKQQLLFTPRHLTLPWMLCVWCIYN